MNNPLLTKVFVTPFDRIEAGHVEPAIDLLIERTQDAVDEIIERAELSYDATLGALDEATDVLEWAAGVVGHLEAVATTDELRAAYLVIQPKLSKFWSGITLNEPLYRLLKDYSHSDAAATLDSVHQRHLTKTLDGFRRSGAELDEA
ncbi:MAG: M3 family peptidase, partial [Gemmatimonadales bacterium]